MKWKSLVYSIIFLTLSFSIAYPLIQGFIYANLDIVFPSFDCPALTYYSISCLFLCYYIISIWNKLSRLRITMQSSKSPMKKWQGSRTGLKFKQSLSNNNVISIPRQWLCLSAMDAATKDQTRIKCQYHCWNS